MECNVGGKDRILRFVAGVVIAALGYFVLSGALTIIAYVIAAILLITAIITYCPLNKVLGINTCKVS